MITVGLLAVVIFAIVSAKKAIARCLDLGITKETIQKVIKASISSAIVPSIAVLVGLVTLSVSLGAAWPWWRLSVIGSLSYESMATTYTADGMGIALSSVLSSDATYFAAIILVMTIGIMVEPVSVALLAKKYSTGLMRASETSDWGQVLTGVFFLGMFAVYLPIMIFTDLPTTLTLFTSFVVTLLCGAASVRFKWLGNFTMAIAMIVAMCSSVLWVHLFA
jgi:hypothetical protein